MFALHTLTYSYLQFMSRHVEITLTPWPVSSLTHTHTNPHTHTQTHTHTHHNHTHTHTRTHTHTHTLPHTVPFLCSNPTHNELLHSLCVHLQQTKKKIGVLFNCLYRGALASKWKQIC